MIYLWVGAAPEREHKNKNQQSGRNTKKKKKKKFIVPYECKALHTVATKKKINVKTSAL